MTLTPRIFAVALFALTLLLSVGCQAPTRVVVLGMLHDEHRTSGLYSLQTVRDTIVAIDPDAVLAEIPPAAMANAERQWRESGAITTGRVAVFPEYTDVLFPLRDALGFEIVPTAGWTPEMAADRRAKLERWQTERPEATAEVDAGQAGIETAIAALGQQSTDPRFIHSEAYDDIVRAGLEPYNRLFNDDLGLGGWDNINAAHYANIEAALDARSGRGETIVITYGAWHKHWFLDKLRARRDVRLLDAQRFFPHARATPSP